jgi:hypothetical protein
MAQQTAREVWDRLKPDERLLLEEYAGGNVVRLADRSQCEQVLNSKQLLAPMPEGEGARLPYAEQRNKLSEFGKDVLACKHAGPLKQAPEEAP